MAYPDIATKAKAQAFIGMDAASLKAEKAAFLESVTPQWDAKAEEREAQYPVKSLFE